MGYQLWTSPTTGYRRKGTRLADLRALLGDGITVTAVLEPLQSCPADAEAVEISRVLSDRSFDVAGVQVASEKPVIGFVRRDALVSGTVREHVQPLTADVLISNSTPLRDLLARLADRESIFVLVGPAVSGIVTRADLNKPAVRVYMFGLISLLEMHLGFWLRRDYPGNAWIERLAARRIRKARALQDLRRIRNQDTDLLDCLQLCDKRDLLLACDGRRESLGLGPPNEAKALLISAEDLRNLLAHSEQDLAQGSSWDTIIRLIQRVEVLVQNSDDLVENAAKEAAGDYRDALWAST